MGSKTNTQTTTSGPSGSLAIAYNNLLNRAQDVASTPYQAYSGNQLAPFSQSQQSAFNTVDQAQGIAQPYINQASQYAQQGAAPITSDQISQYLNPYTQDVIKATQANFNEGNAQQQTQLRGNAIQQGALGNSRVGVAQAELARQQQIAQAPVIAGLNAQGYNTALSSAQQDAARRGQAAYTFGNLGQEALGTTLQGAQAQLATGAQQQQQAQQGLNIPYQQWLQQQAFPYQQTGWLAGIESGLGSQMGGTSTTSTPGPNPTSQYIGAGLAAAGLFLKDGGAVKGYDAGGGIGVAGSPWNAATGWIPSVDFIKGNGLPKAPQPQQQQNQNSGASDMVKNAMGLAKQMKSGFGSPMDISAPGIDTSGYASNLSPGISMDAGLGGLYKRGGYVAQGGMVEPNMDIGIRGYADGGFPDMIPSARIAQGFEDADAAINEGVMDPQGANQGTPTAGYSGVVPLPTARPVMAGINAPAVDTTPAQDVSDTAMAYSPEQPQEGSPAVAGIPAQGSPSFMDKLHSISPALISAGFGMMASRSPFVGTAIGEGGLAGVKTYQEMKAAEREEANRARTAEQTNRRIDLEAKRLDQAAKDAAANLKLRTEQFAETKEQNLRPTWGAISKDAYGNPIYGWIDPRTQTVTPGPHVPGTSAPSAENNGTAATGEEFLKTVDPAIANTVRAIAEGRKPAPTGMMLRTPYGQTIDRALTQFDPAYDATVYNARAQAVKAFSAGPKGDLMRSFDVGISHLNTLQELSNALENRDTQALNRLSNFWKEQTGQTGPSNFETAKGIVGDEIVKAVVGSRGALGDREEAKKVLQAAKSPAQLAGVIKTYKTLMAGQLHGLKKQYEDTTGMKNFENRLSEATRKELLGPATSAASTFAAAPPATERKVNQVYQTPKGPARWMGNGWQLVQ